MARVGGGAYRPPFPISEKAPSVRVRAFLLDRRPVTVAEYQAFVAQHPAWRRDRAPRLLADAGYLRSWDAPDAAGGGRLAGEPATEVSYFAARAYCQARGARLPTEAEWELAARAGEHTPDGRREPGFNQRILDWYARPVSGHPLAGQGPPNHWGLRDLHGLVWEWIADFNAARSANDREAGAAFCGASALGSQQRDDYAAFMRAAFRSALVGNAAVSGLGFRCARDLRER